MVCVRDPARVRVRGQARGARVHRKEPVQARREVVAFDVDLEAAAAPRAEPRGRALFVVDRVKEDYTAEWVLAKELPHIARDEQIRLLETLVHGERSRRNTISAVARLRSYANRDRLSAQVLILDRRALTTVQFYSALFGLPDELFRKVVRAL